METADHETHGTHDMRKQPTPNQADAEASEKAPAEPQSEQPEAANAPISADSAAPMSPLAGFMATVEARHRAAQPEASGKEFMAEQRHGRLEVETKRISEEVTRAAQARLQARPPQPKLAAPTVVTAPAAATTAERAAAHKHLFAQGQTITRVIAPLDGSVSAERALPYAAALAQMAGAPLLLAHISVPHAPAPVEELASLDDRLEGIATADSAPAMRAFDPLTYLTMMRAKISLPTVQLELLDADSVVAGLVELTQAQSGDVIVVAPHHRSMVRRLAFGRVVDGLLQQSGSAVLIVPAQPSEASTVTLEPDAEARQEITPAPSFRRVLVPVDGSTLAEMAIAPLLGLLASATGDANDDAPHEIVLFRVAESYPTLPAAEQYVADLCAELRAIPASMEISWYAAAEVGSPPGAITAAAEQGVQRQSVVSGSGATDQPFDLVVMATHGRGGFTRWLYGSVAAYVLEHIQAPTLLTHPHHS